ncbi:unnamed protein product, partial [Trichogramma brassicae]
MLGLLLMSRALDDEQPTKLPNSSVSTKVAHDVQIRRCTESSYQWYAKSGSKNKTPQRHVRSFKNKHDRESALCARARRRYIHTTRIDTISGDCLAETGYGLPGMETVITYVSNSMKDVPISFRPSLYL